MVPGQVPGELPCQDNLNPLPEHKQTITFVFGTTVDISKDYKHKLSTNRSGVNYYIYIHGVNLRGKTIFRVNSEKY